MKLAFVSQRDSASEHDMPRHESLSDLPCKQTDNLSVGRNESQCNECISYGCSTHLLSAEVGLR